MTKPKKFNAYQDVTNQIIKALEQGVKPWECPWIKDGGGRPLRSNGVPYRGINQLLLGFRSYEMGYRRPVWMTFKQAKDLGGAVRKGEKSSSVVKYGTYDEKSRDKDDEETIQSRCYLKAYRVFNVEQIDGLDTLFPKPDELLRLQTRPINALSHVAVRMIENADIGYKEGGSRAFYSRSSDTVTMPEISYFKESEDFYGTLFHELVHATMAESRCDRIKANEGAEFGNAIYAKEELCAEIGAAFLAFEHGFRPHHIENSAAYIGSWLAALKNDNRMIVRQAAAAQRAAEYLSEKGRLGG